MITSCKYWVISGTMKRSKTCSTEVVSSSDDSSSSSESDSDSASKGEIIGRILDIETKPLKVMKLASLIPRALIIGGGDLSIDKRRFMIMSVIQYEAINEGNDLSEMSLEFCASYSSHRSSFNEMSMSADLYKGALIEFKANYLLGRTFCLCNIEYQGALIEFKVKLGKRKIGAVDFEALSRHGYKGGLSVLRVPPPKEDRKQDWTWSGGKESGGDKETDESYEERQRTRQVLNEGEELIHVQTRREKEEQKEKDRERREKNLSFAQKEKRKRDIGQASRGKSYVEEEKRLLRDNGVYSGFDS
ncbi:hypothetical protein GIB67_023063 [Kingdonia uniflora]|uniref:Uncharacterized protein n=1 Tax=Kingdonia uniflora TaxID=39325 RepID=A0A7J7P893_9MAGN|nr:hypothetical protein GIB67_023063 [Kingdonia uniflora]